MIRREIVSLSCVLLYFDEPRLYIYQPMRRISISLCSYFSLTRCGTKPDMHGQFYENTVVVQYDKDLLEVWDEAKRLRCEWFNDYEKTASKPPMVIADLDVIQLDFRGTNTFEYIAIRWLLLNGDESSAYISRALTTILSRFTARHPRVCTREASRLPSVAVNILKQRRGPRALSKVFSSLSNIAVKSIP